MDDVSNIYATNLITNLQFFNDPALFLVLFS